MPTVDTSAKTPLHEWHAGHGGRMVDFAGWSMPVQYSSIIEEHRATRQAVGLFDISHMGRLWLTGDDNAAELLDRVLTRRVIDMQPGQIRYSLVCNENGGILDDVLVYRFAAADTAPSFFSLGSGARRRKPSWQLVVNAGNRAKIVEWMEQELSDSSIRLHDASGDTAMIAVQGPQAVSLIGMLGAAALSSLRIYHGAAMKVAGRACYVSRTGYTGEDGCEIICAASDAERLWERLVAAAEDAGGRAAGLGARDTLRLEAGMPLYGHELTETIDPIQAGLSFAVTLTDRSFIGDEAIRRSMQDANRPVRMGLQLDGRRVPREGCTILHGEENVGRVTSGTFSPTFERPIAMGYVRPTAAGVGTRLAVAIRGHAEAAVVVPLPFYQRGKE